MPVRSCAYPHQPYVCKSVLNQLNENQRDPRHDEVSHYRPFKYIPEWVKWTSYTYRSYSMAKKFRNGDSLRYLLYHRLCNLCLEETAARNAGVHPPRTFTVAPSSECVSQLPDENLAERAKSKHHIPEVYSGDFGVAHLAWYPKFLTASRRT